MAVDWIAVWNELDERQHQFLRVIYTLECERARYYDRQSALTNPLKRSAEWQWLMHSMVAPERPQPGNGAANGALGRHLEAHGLKDPESGACSVLEERGLIERRSTQQKTVLGTVDILWMRLTRNGRKLCRLHISLDA